MASDRNNFPTRTNEPPDPNAGKALFAAILLFALIAALGLRAVLPPDALAPAIASLLFGLAAAIGAIALLMRRHSRVLDLAGILTFVGVIVSIMIESDQMTRLFVLSDQSQSN